jgi:predicted phosphodiesterase
LKIAVFSDVHGNYLNLISFFNSTEKLNIDKYICLGDLCNYYSDNESVINLIKEKDILCLLGNHDEFYIVNGLLSEERKKKYNFDPTLINKRECIDYLKSLPRKYETSIRNRSIIFCHASPTDLLYSYIYPDTDLDQFKDLPYNFVFIGHTHRQFLKSVGNVTICNVGSIGLPRDNGSLMSFAVLDTEMMDINLYRNEIDVEKIKETYIGKVNGDVIELLSRKEVLEFKYTLVNE